MNYRTTISNGFSAAELIITLFIASLFVIAGTQLYTFVIQNSAEADQRARASNAAYEYLRTKTPAFTGACTLPAPTFAEETLSGVDGLTNVKAQIVVACPYTAGTTTMENVRRVTATVKYGNLTPQLEVKHAVLTTP